MMRWKMKILITFLMVVFFGLASADCPESPVFNETGSGPGAVEPREKPVEAVEQTGDGADQTVPALNRFKEERKQYLIY
jgi:hypothetical protein